MKLAERIVIVSIIVVLIGAGLFLYFTVKNNQQAVRDAVARGEYQIPLPNTDESTVDDNWRKYYPELIPIIIGSTTVQASVADSLPERIKGLSSTPYLPKEIVKLFAFGTAGEHSIWMKDMNYTIDIMWVARSGEIVHIKENVSPDTYPESFASPTPAWYVIEAAAGFVASSSIEVGDEVVVTLPG